jgi:alpha-L-fucosidase
MLNIAVYPDGTIPDDQFAIMEEFGKWINANGEAIYNTEPWKIYGEGGATASGRFKERRINAEPWDCNVHRFTCNKDRKTLYIHIFGNPAGKELTISSLADRKLFKGKVKKVSLIGGNDDIKWSMNRQGLNIRMPEQTAFTTCNTLKVITSGLW